MSMGGKWTPKERAPTRLKSLGRELAEQEQALALTPRERLFVAEYLTDLNATGATARAGYRWPNATAYRLMQRPRVRAAVAAAMTERVRTLGLESRDVVAELWSLAFSSLGDVADWGRRNGQDYLDVHPRDALTPAQQRSIAEVRISEGALRVRQHDKLEAMLLLLRHLGMLKPAALAAEEERREEVKAQQGIGAFLDTVPREVRERMKDLLVEAMPPQMAREVTAQREARARSKALGERLSARLAAISEARKTQGR